MDEIRRKTRCLYPVINKWVNLVHHTKEFSDIYDAMDKQMYERFHSGERPKNEDTESVYANSFLRGIVLDNIFPGENRLKGFFFNTFPGSKLNILTKRSMKSLRYNYYVTPNGLNSVRCMMLSLYVSKFPRWVLKIRDRSSGTSSFQKLHICDNCALHTAVVWLIDSKQKSMEIGFPTTDEGFLLENLEGRFYLTSIDPKEEEEEGEGDNEKEDEDDNDDEEDVITKTKRSRKRKRKENKSKLLRVEIIKKYGKVVNYFCDNNFNFYYVEDEYIFPVMEEIKDEKKRKRSLEEEEEEEEIEIEMMMMKKKIYQKKKKKRVHSYQSVVLLDGEISWNLTTSHYDYRIFDVISFCDRRGKVCSCLSLKLEEKLKIMKHNLVEAYLDYLVLDQQASPPPGMGVDPHHLQESKRIRIKMKDFFEGRDIQSLMDRIHSTTQVYTSKKNQLSGSSNSNDGGDDDDDKNIINRYDNDGVVIVPNDQIQFRYKSTRTLNLFLWRRPENAFINILIYPIKQLSPTTFSSRFIYRDVISSSSLPSAIPDAAPPIHPPVVLFEREPVTTTTTTTKTTKTHHHSVTMDVGTYLSEFERVNLWNRRSDGAVVECAFRNGRVWVIRRILRFFNDDHDQQQQNRFEKNERISNFLQLMYSLQSHIENIGVTELFKIFSGIKYYDTFPLETYRKEMKLSQSCVWSHIRRIIIQPDDSLPQQSSSLNQQQQPASQQRVFEKIQTELNHTELSSTTSNNTQQQQHSEKVWKRMRFVAECVGPNFSYGRKLKNHVNEYLRSLVTDQNRRRKKKRLEIIQQQQQRSKTQNSNMMMKMEDEDDHQKKYNSGLREEEEEGLDIDQKICVRMLYLPSGYFQILDFQNIFKKRVENTASETTTTTTSDQNDDGNRMKNLMRDEDDDDEVDSMIGLSRKEREERELRRVCSFSRCLKNMESQIRWIKDYQTGLRKRKREHTSSEDQNKKDEQQQHQQQQVKYEEEKEEEDDVGNQISLDDREEDKLYSTNFITNDDENNNKKKRKLE